ncbi:MAG: DNA polymerase III subunit gamma/tau [Granulosicoccus sp.]|nr:DNA polymerase III subunit gamma/tau [Granulosicoccus sp.]
MSHKVLARKWRPHHFKDMIGQEHVLRALVNALDSNRLHHAYLFTGMRGVGKTTIARIFAKCLNCETAGVSANPCGECATCQDIDAGRFFDLIEVDAASRTKVDETRELLENVPYAPTSGRFKVYLIDEVHMFSTHSFNALLKTLEEPPEHVKFLLATTDPQKVPVTVLSRCLQFNLKSMAPTRLADYLEKILDAENIEHERAALDLIARAAEGSVRDSLSLVEQAAAFGQGKVLAVDVESMLGRVSTGRLMQLLSYLAKRESKELFQVVDSLDEYAPDYVQVLGELVTILHQVAMLQTVPESVSAEVPEHAALTTLASEMAEDEVQLYYQMGVHARRDMAFVPDTRAAFDMALLRMLAFAPQPNASAGVSPEAKKNSDNLKTPPTTHSGSDPKGSDQMGSDPTPTQTKMIPTPAANLGSDLKPTVEKLGSDQAPITAPVEPTVKPAAMRTGAEISPSGSDPKTDTAVLGSDPKSVAPPARMAPGESLAPDNWASHVARMGLAGMPRQLANHCALVSNSEDTVTLEISPDNEHLNTARFVSRLTTALSEYTGRPLQLSIQESSQPLDTPALRNQQAEAEALEAAKASIEADPLVRQLINQVDGVVDSESVQPVTENQN